MRLTIDDQEGTKDNAETQRARSRRESGRVPPTPVFFVKADSKGLAVRFGVKADSKGVTQFSAMKLWNNRDGPDTLGGFRWI